jgi:hypothetical protein
LLHPHFNPHETGVNQVSVIALRVILAMLAQRVCDKRLDFGRLHPAHRPGALGLTMEKG